MRRRVQWLKDQKPQQPSRLEMLSRIVSRRDTIDAETESLYTEHLFVGSLWIASEDLSSVKAKENDIPTAIRSSTVPFLNDPSIRPIKAGSPAVYAGAIRAEETGKSGQLIRVLKHTFIVNSTRVIASSLLCFKPA